MADHAIDVTAFREKFPAFSDAGSYPDATLTVFWNLGAEFLGKSDGPLLCGSALQTALDYMGAHLLHLSGAQTRGDAVGVLTQATIDKVSVSLAPPPVRSAWGHWLASSPYGMALSAFLSLQSAGGLYIGGSPARAGFRGPLG